MNYYKKYFKYKSKYLNLVKLIGGDGVDNFIWIIDIICSQVPIAEIAESDVNIDSGILRIKRAILAAMSGGANADINTILQLAKRDLHTTPRQIDYLTVEHIIEKSKDARLQFLRLQFLSGPP